MTVIRIIPCLQNIIFDLMVKMSMRKITYACFNINNDYASFKKKQMHADYNIIIIKINSVINLSKTRKLKRRASVR